MDAGRFDALARRLTSRLRLRLLATGLLPLAVLPTFGSDPAEAKKKKKCKKKCGGCRQCKKGKCKPKPDGTPCGQDRLCGGGQCLCGAEFAPCDGRCCPFCDSAPGAVCMAACPAGAVSVDACGLGSCCACATGKLVCNGACVDGCPSGQRLDDACRCVPG